MKTSVAWELKAGGRKAGSLSLAVEANARGLEGEEPGQGCWVEGRADEMGWEGTAGRMDLEEKVVGMG